MLVVDLTGTHYDMGYQHGIKLAQYRQALLGLIEEYRRIVSILPWERVEDILRDVTDLLHLRSPQTLDMLRGLSDAFSVPMKDLLGIRLRGYMEDRAAVFSNIEVQDAECTAWALSNPNAHQEKTLIAKNRDTLISNRDLQAVFRCSPEKGHAYFTLNSIGSCNTPSCGMNAEGLAIVDTRVTSTDVGTGLPRFTLMMHALEQFTSVKEVIDFLGTVPRMGGGNLVFADAKGEVAKAEVGFQCLEVQHKDAGFVACANHFDASSTRTTYRKKSDDSERDSRWRLATVSRELSRMEETLDSHAAMRLMSLHGETYSICRHGQATGTATISSVLFIPERHGFYCCQGVPCTMPFDWIGF